MTPAEISALQDAAAHAVDEAVEAGVPATELADAVRDSEADALAAANAADEGSYPKMLAHEAIEAEAEVACKGSMPSGRHSRDALNLRMRLCVKSCCSISHAKDSAVQLKLDGGCWPERTEYNHEPARLYHAKLAVAPICTERAPNEKWQHHGSVPLEEWATLVEERRSRPVQHVTEVFPKPIVVTVF